MLIYITESIFFKKKEYASRKSFLLKTYIQSCYHPLSFASFLLASPLKAEPPKGTSKSSVSIRHQLLMKRRTKVVHKNVSQGCNLDRRSLSKISGNI